MPRNTTKLTSSVLLLLTALCSTVLAQTSEADIKARLKDKPLYLRGFWRDGNLRFDEQGRLLGSSAPVSFTLAGFDLDSISMKPNRLLLHGKRVGTEFIKDVPKRVSLGNLRLEIAKPASGDFTQALDAIFANGLDEIAKSLPWYWQGYATCTILHSTESPKCIKPVSLGASPVLPNGRTSPPRITKMVDAQFTEQARQFRYSGTTLISLVIEPNGSVSHLAVIRPAGLGLDEQALVAAAKYKFDPAMEDQKPVGSEVEIQVKFDIY